MKRRLERRLEIIVIVGLVALMLSMLAACGDEKGEANNSESEGDQELAQEQNQAQGQNQAQEQAQEQNQAQEQSPLATGNITEENIEQIKEILDWAGASNTEIFKKWVKKMTGDEAVDEAADGEGPSSGFNDADCRMTAMLLIGDQIKFDSLEEEYMGDYLMFDLDAIENNEEFSMLKERKELFTTLFGETQYDSGSDPEKAFANALGDKWKSHGIRVENEKCSIISLVFKAYEESQAFVGHTGILIDCQEMEAAPSKFVFIEKIAFSEPFVVTLVESEEELITALSERPDYSVEEGDPAPTVYKNGELIGRLKG